MGIAHHCEGAWKDGSVKSCPLHEKNRNKQPLRQGLKDRRKADAAAGVVGVDRTDTYGYIDGGETHDFG